MNPYIWIAVGMPACGKSTWIDKNVNTTTTQEIQILGTDRIIDQIAALRGDTYEQTFKGSIDDATKIFFGQLHTAFLYGQNIFIDRTNLSIKSRRRILSMVPKNYKKIALVFKCSDETHSARLKSRPGKNIPDAVIASMKASFQYPTLEEGFDVIQEIVTE